jgi:hypothetical protein
MSQSEPNYQSRISVAETKLDAAKTHLEQALEDARVAQP